MSCVFSSSCPPFKPFHKHCTLNITWQPNSTHKNKECRGDILLQYTFSAWNNIYGNDYDTEDGTCVRDYIHVSDISLIHILALKRISKLKKSLILNCGYGKGISVLDAVKEFEKQIKKNIKIKYKKRRKGDMKKIIADNKKIKKFLKWKPNKNSLSKIVKSCIKWERKINN